MQLSEYAERDALGLAELVRTEEVTADEVLTTALALAETLNPAVGALTSTYERLARVAIAAGLPQGPFVGVPFALKDLLTSWSGTPTSNGSRLFAGQVADHDDELVHRWRASGVVLFAKSATAELGLSPTTESALTGPTRNPWDLTRSAGGSSGGAAAAVAAGILPMAHASDGGGSIRIPASRCGLFGLKPTRGRTSSAPDRGEGWAGLSVQHVVSRTVRDSAAALDATAGPVEGDPYWAPPPVGPFLAEVGRDPGRLRIGICTEAPNGAPVDPQVRDAALGTARRLADLGHDVVEVVLPFGPEQLGPVQAALIPSHAAAAVDEQLARLGREQRPDDLEPVTAAMVAWGRQNSARTYIAGVQAMHALGRLTAGLFAEIDLLLTPTCGDLPPALGLLDGTDMERFVANVGPSGGFASLANATGQPAVSLPLDRSREGLPIGSQLVGRFGAEAVLLRVSAQLEGAHPWPHTASAAVTA